jgi:hypothetical protein
MPSEEPRVERPAAHGGWTPCPTARRLPSSVQRIGSIRIIPRSLDPVVLQALDAVPAGCLPKLRVTGNIGSISQAIDTGLGESGLTHSWLADWLTDDAAFLMRLFQSLVGAKKCLVRLEAVEGDACRRFHADNVRFRLVTTYRGPGTEWLRPSKGNLASDDPSPSPEEIQRFERGHIAIMRGGREAAPDRPAILHRSPQIAGTGVTRLFIAIDDAADHER